MSRTIICTVGTSLLTNPDRPWGPWRQLAALPDLDGVVGWLRAADMTSASAETNTLRALEVGKSDRLAFLHSDTEEGLLCANALCQHYAKLGVPSSVERIGELGYGAAAFTKGLKGLVDLTLRLVRQANEQHRVPILCATGGFKAEIAFLNLLGALLAIEVVYIHERFRELVHLPRLPLAWNDDFVERYEDFFVWIDQEPRRSHEVESRLKATPELRSLVEDDHEGHTLLTAAGDLLFKAASARRSMGPRAIWPEADPRPPGEKNTLSNVEHHRPTGWERAVNHLCSIDCVKSVRYDNRARGARVKIIASSNGELGVCFGDAGNYLPLLIETTARGDEQCQLVADYILKIVR
jgi:putative CRISPR-associated protein (TIGR02619 family)